MERKRKMSRTTMEVLMVLTDDPGTLRHGYALIKSTGIKAGSMYPILQRLEEDRLVEAQWESNIDPAEEGRPRRRYYKITGLGQAVLEQELQTLHPRMRGLIPGTA